MMAITFDQYQRYKNIEIIVDEIKQYYKKDKLKILEVGSNEQLNLGKFLPNEDITYSDLSIPENINEIIKFIKADATNLNNINDNQFDIVISTDVLEHIPKELRKKFISETSRVAKLLNVHCFPFNSEWVKSAEIRANEYYKAIYGENHKWLIEHIENGLPNMNSLEDILQSMNKSYFTFEHGDILTWEEMTKSVFYSYMAPQLIAFQDKIDDYYKENIFINDVGEKNYRKFLIISNYDGISEHLNKRIKSRLKSINNMSERYLNFLYKNIEDMKSIVRIHNNSNIVEEKSELYFDNGDGFNEKEKINYSYTVSEGSGFIDLLVNIPETAQRIRFDPVEGKSIVVSGLSIISNCGEIDYTVINGFNVERDIAFNTNDPQIIINISNKKIEYLKIQANVAIFNYNSSISIFNKLESLDEKDNQINERSNEIKNLYCKIKDINNELKNVNEHKNKLDFELEKVNNQRNQLDSELENYKIHYNAAINQREELKRRLTIIENSYNIISHSTCWKSTKPIRIALDLSKKILKSNKYTYITCRGIKCLKENGFKYTIKRVKTRVRNVNKYNEYTKHDILTDEEKKIQINTKFPRDIKFSIVVPLYNTPKGFLVDMINSCINQTYRDWELCLADGSDKQHGYVSKIVKDYMKKDQRIKYEVLKQNNGISENTNQCIKMSTGDYIALFDHDDILHPSALFEYMKVICEKDADFIYCDEDKFDKDINERFDPYFKPDFAIDNLRANNYICHFTVFKKSLINEVGLFRKEFDGSQDHDMILRLIEKAKSIVHIPKILYHWRVSADSVASDPYAKPYTIEAGIKAVQEHLERCNIQAKVESSTVHPNYYRIKYKIIGEPLISILIPNKDHIEDLSRCINSILVKSTYKNIEIIIIENNSEEEETFNYYKTLDKYENIKIVTYKTDGKFNYSKINNFGVKYANGEHLLFLNNDIEVISDNWLEEMIMYSQREDVGAVGAKLYYPNGTLQHCGVILGIGGVAGHSHKYFERQSDGYFGRCKIQQDLSAVTAACLMMKKSIFDEVEGFDETFEVAFNDVDLCMRIRRAGYLITFTPYAELYHYESISRGAEDTPEKQVRFSGEIRRFQDRWNSELEQGDPYYNVNLTLEKEDFSIK